MLYIYLHAFTHVVWSPAAASWLRGEISGTMITGGCGILWHRSWGQGKDVGGSRHAWGREQIFFCVPTQAPQLEGGGQVWKPVRDHQLKGVLMRCSWHLGEVCGWFCLAGRFSSCGVGRVISNAAFMTHPVGYSLSYTHRGRDFCFSGLQVGQDLQHKCVSVCKKMYYLVVMPFFLFEKQHCFLHSLLLRRGSTSQKKRILRKKTFPR